MNGRVYDYNVGRFMGVDPVIVDPTNSQAINPYSYVMNNPLGYTDPSGYTAECPEGQVCDISDINKEDIEDIQITNKGDAIVTTKNGDIHKISTINGADASGSYKSFHDSISDIDAEKSVLSTVSGFIKKLGQEFLDHQAGTMAESILGWDPDDVEATIKIPISESEREGEKTASAAVGAAGAVAGAINFLVSIRKGSFEPSKEMIKAALGSLVQDGAINIDHLLPLIPPNMKNEFGLKNTEIAAGRKYTFVNKFKFGNHKVEIRWHSPDPKAQRLHPSSNSARAWTVQIKVGKHRLLRNGEWSAHKKVGRSNRAHIPLIRNINRWKN